MTASREKLVVMLYEGALKHIDRAEHALQTKKDAVVAESLSRCFAIIGELRAALDFQTGGELAQELNRLYGYVLSQLIDANRSRTPKPLAAARSILLTLKEGWDAILGQ